MPEPTTRLPKAYYRTLGNCSAQAGRGAARGACRIALKIGQSRTHALRTLSEGAVLQGPAIATNGGVYD